MRYFDDPCIGERQPTPITAVCNTKGASNAALSKT